MPDISMGSFIDPIGTEDGIPIHHQDINKRIQRWIDAEGFRSSGITLSDLSLEVGTNRTYLSQYINTVYGMNFRDWITDLRIEYAKSLMSQHPQLRVQEVFEASGFQSLSHFTRIFTIKEGCSPSKWRSKR